MIYCKQQNKTEVNTVEENIRQNLIDAGCDEEFIKRFDCCICDKKQCEKMLANHRKELLQEVHEKEDNISCLDYLVYKMKQEDLE